MDDHEGAGPVAPPPRERRRSVGDRRKGPRRLGDEPYMEDRLVHAPAPVPVDVQGLPNWLRAAVFLGVPSVIAMFLVYWLSVDISKRMATVEAQVSAGVTTVNQINEAIARRQDSTQAMREHFDDAVQQLNDNLRRLCVAISETPQERASCLTRGRVE